MTQNKFKKLLLYIKKKPKQSIQVFGLAIVGAALAFQGSTIPLMVTVFAGMILIILSKVVDE